MNLPKLSIQRPVLAWMITLAIFLFGGISLSRMGISLLPDVDNPNLSISAVYSGASPESIESDVIEILEGALSGVEGITRMSSSSRYGSGSVSLEFDIDRNIDAAVQDVQAAIQGVMRQLPEDVETPTVRKSNPEDQPIMWVALSGPDDLRTLMLFARNSLRDRFSSIEGVADVQLGGYISPAVRIWLDPQKLLQYELTYEDVVQSIQSEHREIPTGRLNKDKSEISLRFKGEFQSIEELSKLSITRRSGQSVFRRVQLSDLGTIEAGLDEIRSSARADGQTAIGLGIKKQRGSNAVAVADAVMARMKEISLPEGYKLSVNFDSTKSIRHSVYELGFTLVLSVILTAFVCWLFLGSLSSTVNILLAIPTSLLGSFVVMSWLGYTLNNFTMLALILSIGIVVDDAIMVLENIFRFRRSEAHRGLAALRGAEQVQFAAIATSLAIIAIFIPVVYIDGSIGAYLTQFGITLSIAVAFSTIEALTFTPMRLASFAGSGDPKGLPALFDRWVQRSALRYQNTIQVLLNHKWKTYMVTTLIFLASLSLIKFLPKEMVPDDDAGVLLARAELPLGTSLQETSRRLEELEKILQDDKNISYVYSIIGGFGGSEVNNAILFVTLKDKDQRKQSHIEVQDQLRKKFKTLGSDFQVRLSSLGGGGLGGRRGYPIDLTLKGSNFEDLISSSQNLKKAMELDSSYFVDVDTDFETGSPELSLVPNRDAALARSVSMSAISQTLAFVYNGVQAGKFNEDGRRIDIILKADPSKSPSRPEDLKNLYIRNGRGQLIRLSELVEINDSFAPTRISRENRERTISVYANLAKGTSMDKAQARAEELSQKSLAASVRLDESGSRGDFNKAFRDMAIALGLGVLVAYMILASQFNSYIHPFTILLALPFSVSGAFLALKLSNSSINLYSMIGLLLLMGIVKKNSIMLVEFANQEREKNGFDSVKAILEACKTRYRPILMTAFTTIASALPPALKIGIDSEATASMSVGIVGGVFLSTLLTFFVVPVAYVHLSRFEKHESLLPKPHA